MINCKNIYFELFRYIVFKNLIRIYFFCFWIRNDVLEEIVCGGEGWGEGGGLCVVRLMF